MKTFLQQTRFQFLIFISIALAIAATPGFFGWWYSSKQLVTPAVDSMLNEQAGLVVRSLGIPLTTGNMELFWQQLEMAPGETIKSVKLIGTLNGEVYYQSGESSPETGPNRLVQSLAKDHKLIHSQIDGNFYDEYIGIPIVSSCLRCHDGVVAEDYNGREGQISSYFKVSSDISKFIAIEKSRTTYLAIATAAIIGLLVLVFLFVWYSLVRPTQRLQRSLADIVSGDGDLTKRLPVNKSELGEISALLNQLMKKISDILVPIKGLAGELHSTSNDLTQTASQSKQTVIDLTGAAEGNEQTARQLSASVDAIVQENSEVVQQVHDTRQLASDGLDRVTEVVGGMNKIYGNTQTFTEKMSDLEGNSEKIGKILKTIEEIAFQTNLLALNAAVEAARAGNAGKGFAVVAEEVRNLASRSAGAAEEIATMIQSVQDDTKEAMKQSTENAEGVKRGAMSVQEIGTTMENIVTAIIGVSENINNVAKTTEEQAAASSEVAGYAASVKASGAEISHSSTAVAVSAEQITGRICQLEEQLSKFTT